MPTGLALRGLLIVFLVGALAGAVAMRWWVSG